MQRMRDGRKPVAQRVVLTAGVMALAGAVPARRSVKVAGASFALVLALLSALWLAPFAGAVPTVCPDDNPACQSDIPGVPDNPDAGGPGDSGDVVPEDPPEVLPEDPPEVLPEDPAEVLPEDPAEPIESVVEDEAGWIAPEVEEILNPELPKLDKPTAPINEGLEDIHESIKKIDTNVTGPIDSGTTFKRSEPTVQERPTGNRGGAPGAKTATDDGAEPPALAGFSEARSLSGTPTDSERDVNVALAADGESIQPGLFDRVGEVSVEVAKKLAFPLALLVLVAAFLLIHNRIDRRDPKLAHAPVSTEHESLTFE